MARVSLAVVAISALVGCGGESAPSTPVVPEPEVPAARAPAPEGPVAAPDPGAPAAPVADPLARAVDPDGHSTIALRETRGSRTFALVLRDEVRRGMNALTDADAEDAVLDAYESSVIRCADVPCMAQLAPSLGMLAETVAGRGASWHLAIVEGDRVVARRSLVALTIHEPGASGTTPPRMRVEDVDGDSRLEVIVEVPVRPIRDDTMLTEHYDESGSVAFVLDETALAVQARWTSEVSVSGGGEWVGDDYDDVWTESCTRSEEIAGRALVIFETCGEGDEREVRCPYEAAGDRFACPARFAEELLRPLGRHDVQHYVADDEQALERVLGRIGSRFDEIRLLARDAVAAEARDALADGAGSARPPTPTPAPTPAIAAATGPAPPPTATVAPPPVAAAPAAAACPLVVDDPAPPLHVRAEPSARSAIVGDAPNGTRVTYLERRGRWGRIATPVAGWIWTENVRARCD